MTTSLGKACLWLVTVAVSALAYPRLPATVPVHWGLDGQPDRWGSRWELLLLGPVLLLVLGVLERALERRDQVKQPGDDQGPRRQVSVLASGLVACVHVLLLGYSTGVVRDFLQAMVAGLSLFWVPMGNVMGRVRPNRTVGIRTPWVFRSPEVWRRTHRLAGVLMVLAGTLGLVGALALPGPQALTLLIGLLLASTLGPAVYSYVLWQREQGT